MKNKRFPQWFLLVILAAMVGLSGCGNETEQREYRVGLLSGVDSFDGVFDGFKLKMAELGYVEGENVSYDFQAAGGDPEKMAAMAEQFVEEGVDLIVSTTNGGVAAVHKATQGTEIPVVFAITSNLVKMGIVEDMGQPGGNMTGLQLPASTHYGKRLEFLTEIAPDARRVWLVYNTEYPAVPAALEAIRQVAAGSGIELIETQVTSSDEFANEVNQRMVLEDPGVDAIFLMPDPFNITGASAMMEFGRAHNLPVIAATKVSVELGGLYTYSFDPVQTGLAAASFADKIFKGADPGDLPIETSDLFLVLNLQVADALGLNVPDHILQVADEIFR